MSKETLRAKRAKEAEEDNRIMMRQQTEKARRRDQRNGTVTGRCNAAAVRWQRAEAHMHVWQILFLAVRV